LVRKKEKDAAISKSGIVRKKCEALLKDIHMGSGGDRRSDGKF
jgi:hypothetical protein